MSPLFEQQLYQCLQKFKPHSLADLNNASLMNRIDTKFIVPMALVPTLLERLKDEYTVLEINDKRVFRYQSTYFDTDDFELYHLHHNKRLNRHKVRLRHYVDDDSHFLEVKFKNNKKRTIKSRIRVNSDSPLDLGPYQAFLTSTGLPVSSHLKPSLVSQYKRTALACEARAERLTLDFDLVKHNVYAHGQQPVFLQDTVIAELKQSRYDRNSPFFQVARELNLRATGFSKYCIGVALTTPDENNVKNNRFKPITRKVTLSTIES